MFAMGDSESVTTGSTRPAVVEPLAGNQPSFTDKNSSRKEPMINEGMEMKAVVSTMMNLSSTVLRRSAATAPSTTPSTAASTAAMRPSFTEVRRPSAMMSLTWRPRCFSDGPKSNLVTTSFR